MGSSRSRSGGGPARSPGDLRQRAGDDDALLFAAAQRRERAAPRSRPCRWPPAPRAPPRNRAGPRPRTRRDAGSGPSARPRARSSRTRDASPAGTTAMRRARTARARVAAGPGRRASRVRPTAAGVPASTFSSVVLPEPFGPEDADEAAPAPPSRRRAAPARSAVAERDVGGLQQRAAQRAPREEAPGIRTARTCPRARISLSRNI